MSKRTLVDKLVVKIAGRVLQETVGYDLFKIWEDLFLSKEEHDRLLEGIEIEDLNQIRPGCGYKRNLRRRRGRSARSHLQEKNRIRRDHQILTDQGVFYPQALYNDLTFEMTLAGAKHVVKGSNSNKLV